MARKAKETAEEDPLAEVERLSVVHEVASAARLAELAASSDKAVSKAARRGLYRLRQAGIEPPSAPTPVPAAVPAQQLASKAYVTNPDGNGSQMLLFIQDVALGGSPWLLTFLINYGTGLKDLGASRLSRREINESLEGMRARPGRIVVEAPVDYARWLLQQAVAINRRESLPIPQGYAEDLKRVGLPEREYEQPLIYERLDAEQVREDPSVSHDPDKLFESDLLKPWLINLRVIAPWVEKYAEAFNTQLALDEAQLKQRGDKVIDEAADALLAENGAAVYRRLLEEAALTLSINGGDALAKQALYHALSLTDGQSPHENPFLRALTARSIFVLIALYARDQEELERAKGAPGPAGIAEPESPGLIERV